MADLSKTVTSTELSAKYRRLLSQTEELLIAHRKEPWAKVFQKWRMELDSPGADLTKHAVRTARSMGGLGSISLIALLSRDERFTQLVDELYETCRQIRWA